MAGEMNLRAFPGIHAGPSSCHSCRSGLPVRTARDGHYCQRRARGTSQCSCPKTAQRRIHRCSTAAYFTCRDSMYLVRFATRCCTSPWCPLLTLQNNVPHTGMSFDPCAGSSDSLRMEDETFSEGYFPPLFLLSRVRLLGGIFSALAAGPPPLPSVPWQTAQYAVYIPLPDAGDVNLTGTCSMTFSVGPGVWSCAATVPVNTIRAVNITIIFFMDIAFSPFKPKALLLKPKRKFPF